MKPLYKNSKKIIARAHLPEYTRYLLNIVEKDKKILVTGYDGNTIAHAIVDFHSINPDIVIEAKTIYGLVENYYAYNYAEFFAIFLVIPFRMKDEREGLEIDCVCDLDRRFNIHQPANEIIYRYFKRFNINFKKYCMMRSYFKLSIHNTLEYRYSNDISSNKTSALKNIKEIINPRSKKNKLDIELIMYVFILCLPVLFLFICKLFT